MFGYVLPDKPDLRVREWERYHAVYCALCYELRRFGLFTNLMLHYDFVFAAMLHLSLSDEAPVFYAGRCRVNPLQKELLMHPLPQLTYSAAALVLSAHYKLADDRADETLPRRIGAGLASGATHSAHKKARALYPEMDAVIADCMARQAQIEREGCDSVDRASHATAQGLSYIFEQMSDDSATGRVLARLGYMTGRFAYLADAADDLQKDIQRGRYNVLAQKHGLKKGDDALRFIQEAQGQLRMTSVEIELCYRLLHPKHFDAILDNIVYRGLPAAGERIGNPKKGDRHERSL